MQTVLQCVTKGTSETELKLFDGWPKDGAGPGFSKGPSVTSKVLKKIERHSQGERDFKGEVATG